MGNNNLEGSGISYNLPPNLQSLWVMFDVYLIIPINAFKNGYAEILQEIASLGQHLAISKKIIT